jgi:tripartite-type tricarboxylate transporter receptor subunit TctC
MARLLGDKLSALWGQQVVVDDRPGAGGLIGTEVAAHATPDGYTLYVATDGPLTVAATLNKHVPYDWKRDFAPVSMITVGYQALIVDPKLPVRTLAEFIALAKSKPGALNYASIGVGTAPHLAAELFKSAAQVDLTHVPYNGSSAQAIRALIAGDVAMFMVGTSTAGPFIRSGEVRGLAVTSTESRVDGLPDVPTFTEAGLPQVDYILWFAIAVPSATPVEIIKKLNADINKVVADPDYQKALKHLGFEAKGSTPGELAAFMEKDYIKNRDLIQKLDLHLD